MLRALIRSTAANRFLGRVLVLSGGTVGGQALLVLSAPLLTRLYTPEAFGHFAVFAAFSAMLTTIVNLRFEFAVPVAESDDEAAAVVVLAVVTALPAAAVTALLVWLFGPAIAGIAGMPGLVPLLWLLPVSVLAFGLGSPLAYWSVRRQAFAVNAANRLLYAGTQAGGQILLGLAGLAGAGLVLGYALGYVARFLHFLIRLPTADRRLLAAIDRKRLWPTARRHPHYPLYAAPSSILQSACQMLPAVLVALLYGPAVAGWYALGQRIVGLPVRVLSEAASQVFLGTIPTLDAAGLNRLFLRTAGIFLACGLVLLAPLLVAGPFLFALVFGEPWREAGIIVQLLVPLYLARFVVLPISQTLNVLGRLDLHLWSSLLLTAAMAASFLAGWWLKWEAAWTIGLFSLASTLAFLVYLGLSWITVRRNLAAPA